MSLIHCELHEHLSAPQGTFHTGQRVEVRHEDGHVHTVVVQEVEPLDDRHERVLIGHHDAEYDGQKAVLVHHG